ncbi:hypothetical protein Fmac_015947 [Flemingia macrophylla]|uniref:Uncharacterized protein n=1 Tax=Flemingia macrophylla TaxID=520843 RepID=A0ABD1MG07_9FABA
MKHQVVLSMLISCFHSKKALFEPLVRAVENGEKALVPDKHSKKIHLIGRLTFIS